MLSTTGSPKSGRSDSENAKLFEGSESDVGSPAHSAPSLASRNPIGSMAGIKEATHSLRHGVSLADLKQQKVSSGSKGSFVVPKASSTTSDASADHSSKASSSGSVIAKSNVTESLTTTSENLASMNLHGATHSEEQFHLRNVRHLVSEGSVSSIDNNAGRPFGYGYPPSGPSSRPSTGGTSNYYPPQGVNLYGMNASQYPPGPYHGSATAWNNAPGPMYAPGPASTFSSAAPSIYTPAASSSYSSVGPSYGVAGPSHFAGAGAMNGPFASEPLSVHRANTYTPAMPASRTPSSIQAVQGSAKPYAGPAQGPRAVWIPASSAAPSQDARVLWIPEDDAPPPVARGGGPWINVPGSRNHNQQYGPPSSRLNATAAEFGQPEEVAPWNPSHLGKYVYLHPMQPINWRHLLEPGVTTDWDMIVDKIISSNDQQASIFLQQKIKNSDNNIKDDIIDSIIARGLELMGNRFGNFLIQRVFECANPAQIMGLAAHIRDHTVRLSTDAFGCHVIQKAFDCVPETFKHQMVRELLRCIRDTIVHRYACHVWQKLFELRWQGPPPMIMGTVNAALIGQWTQVAVGETGSLVVQNIFENCNDTDKRPCIDEVLGNLDYIARGQYGNWCIQHICEHGSPDDRDMAIQMILHRAADYSMDQYASKCIEKCLKVCGPDFLQGYLQQVLSKGPDDSFSPLVQIARDQYGNFLIQWILNNAAPQLRDVVQAEIRKHLVSLRGNKYGSKVALTCGYGPQGVRPGVPFASGGHHGNHGGHGGHGGHRGNNQQRMHPMLPLGMGAPGAPPLPGHSTTYNHQSQYGYDGSVNEYYGPPHSRGNWGPAPNHYAGGSNYQHY